MPLSNPPCVINGGILGFRNYKPHILDQLHSIRLSNFEKLKIVNKKKNFKENRTF